ncbi:MAG: hypothetical protein ABI972_04495 [Acidobacteriota bacterium]
MRIFPKDTSNECELFSSRVTVAREGTSPGASASQGATSQAPRTPADARAAFDNLFKK